MNIKNIFENVKDILCIFNKIFKDILLSNDEKFMLYPFLYNKLLNIYNIINKEKKILIKSSIFLDEHFYVLFNDILNKLNKIKKYKKQNGGINLLINNRNLINYINVISNNKYNNIDNDIILFYKNICNFLIYLSKKKYTYVINNIISNLKKNQEIDKELNIYLQFILHENTYNYLTKNKINYLFLNYFKKYIISKEKINIIGLIHTFEELNKKIDNYLFLYFQFLSHLFSNNLSTKSKNKLIFLIIIIYGIIILEKSIIKIFNQKNDTSIQFILFYTFFYMSMLKIII